ncbi:MAG: glutaredoxin domain-containing protein [Cyanobium sp. MAG06]|nr:glutaredoxin domain-containing protein [Cyanobium sp. MAG06]
MKELVIYSKPNCPYCDKVKSYLSDLNIKYQEINILENIEHINKLRELGLMSVPQIFCNGELFIEDGYTGLMNMDKDELLNKLK